VALLDSFRLEWDTKAASGALVLPHLLHT